MSIRGFVDSQPNNAGEVVSAYLMRTVSNSIFHVCMQVGGGAGILINVWSGRIVILILSSHPPRKQWADTHLEEAITSLWCTTQID